MMSEADDSVGLGLPSPPVPLRFDRIALSGGRFVALLECRRLTAGRNARGRTAPAHAGLVFLVLAPPCRAFERRFGGVWGFGHRLRKVCRIRQYAWRS